MNMSNHENRERSLSSTRSSSSTEGQGHSDVRSEFKDKNSKRYKDICYGSPFRKVSIVEDL